MVKVLNNEERLKNFHRPEEIKKVWQPNVNGIFVVNLEQQQQQKQKQL